MLLQKDVPDWKANHESEYKWLLTHRVLCHFVSNPGADNQGCNWIDGCNMKDSGVARIRRCAS